MKIKRKFSDNEEGELCPNCKFETHSFYTLDGWENDWLCANCFCSELLDSEAGYHIIPNVKLKMGKIE
jgi:hypothetical protein